MQGVLKTVAGTWLDTTSLPSSHGHQAEELLRINEQSGFPFRHGVCVSRAAPQRVDGVQSQTSVEHPRCGEAKRAHT